MVELARAVVTGSSLVMLDEPASGLDNAETDRLSAIGGKLGLESQPGQGARVILEAPLPVQRTAGEAVSSVAQLG